MGNAVGSFRNFREQIRKIARTGDRMLRGEKCRLCRSNSRNTNSALVVESLTVLVYGTRS